jgi:Asp-tRNA(Asn)/Glu-tRNA(Gln) amidotransferase A subunit family amidase
VLDGVLARIAAVDGDLSAFVVAIDADRACPAAAPADAEFKRGRWPGHLLGVPIAVKELFDVAPARDPASGT